MACAKPGSEGANHIYIYIYISPADGPFYHASVMLLLIISAAVSPFLIQRWDMGSLTCADMFYVFCTCYPFLFIYLFKLVLIN